MNTRTEFRDYHSYANIILKTLSIYKTFRLQIFVTWQHLLFRHSVARQEVDFCSALRLNKMKRESYLFFSSSALA